MSEAGMKALLDRWVEDPGFRGQLRSDPDAAVATMDVPFDEDSIEFLRSVDWTMSDEELEPLLEQLVRGYC